MNSKIPISYIYNEFPIYVKCKKHFCPECGARLKVGYDSVIVNYYSPEAESYNFMFGDVIHKGDVEFRTCYFECPECGFTIPFDEMRALEKAKRK